jgi:hypothetical protein
MIGPFLVSNKLESMWQEAAMTQFEVTARPFVWTEELLLTSIGYTSWYVGVEVVTKKEIQNPACTKSRSCSSYHIAKVTELYFI